MKFEKLAQLCADNDLQMTTIVKPVWGGAGFNSLVTLSIADSRTRAVIATDDYCVSRSPRFITDFYRNGDFIARRGSNRFLSLQHLTSVVSAYYSASV